MPRHVTGVCAGEMVRVIYIYIYTGEMVRVIYIYIQVRWYESYIYIYRRDGLVRVSQARTRQDGAPQVGH